MSIAARFRTSALAVVMLCATVHAGTIYVSTAGNDANDGFNWTTAKRTVQAGLNAATASDQVWVGAGTHAERITLKAGVALYGGFVGGETDLLQRDWTKNATILDGNNDGTVVKAPSGSTQSTRIDGFTIRNGSYCGIYCYSASPTISNNIITGNTSPSHAKGGGIYCYLASPTIANNTITGNSAASGAGIYCDWSSPTIANNTITGNSASSLNPNDDGGGGIYCYSHCSPMIMNNTIAGNRASYKGAGIYCFSSATIANNIIMGNYASGRFGYGGGIYCAAGSSVTIANNTIASNNAADGGGIYCAGTSPTIVNTIIAFNSSGICSVSSGSPSLRYSCVYGNPGYNYSGLTDPAGANGNIAVDPKLASLPYGGVPHIQPDSPCLNAGDDSVVQAAWIDMDGQTRILGAHVDIGADESDGTGWPTTPNIIIRVAPEGNDANDGSSWSLCKRTVQAGIDTAASAGGEVWVKAGTYVEQITLRNRAHVYGGFAGMESQRAARDWAHHVTTLEGGQAGRVITADGISYLLSTIDGFTIRHGTASTSYGGGIICSSSHPTIANNTITANEAFNGGGISCWLSSPIISNNTIRANACSSSGSGGGIYCDSSSPVITGNTITGNSYDGIYCLTSPARITNNTIKGNSYHGVICATSSVMLANNTITANGISGWSGGGVYCSGGAPVIINNAITHNLGYDGAGIYCSSCSPTIANNHLSGNMATLGGGIYCTSCSPTIVNNTIVSNYAEGIYCTSCPSLVIANTIVAFNSSGMSVPSTSSLRYNCVYGNDIHNYAGIADPTGTNGNIAADPQLASVAYGDNHIQPDSPCTDAGDDSAVLASWNDIDGQARIFRAHVDIGADESDGTTWPVGPYSIVRISPQGDDANDGSSWSLAKQTVQAGIDAAATVGGEVWVKAGTYPQRINLRNFVHVYGGFAGTETERSGRDWASSTTVLDGGQGGSVVTASQILAGRSTIDGFTIRGGAGSSGGGISCYLSSLTIANNAITGNGVTSTGGGIYCNWGSPTITNNTVTGNTAAYGGGIHCNGGSAKMVGNTITGNTASNGGGIYGGGGNPLISNNTITSNNASTNGGGIYWSGGSATIVNTMICGNCGSAGGGGVYLEYSSATTMANDTVVGNAASSGGGVYSYASSPTIANTILAYNSSGILSADSGTITARSNCVYGNTIYNYSGLADPTGTNGNIAVDPQLAQLYYVNVHVQPHSPCAGAGDDSVVHTGWLDMDGQPRIQGAHVDIGADESDGTVWPARAAVVVRVSPQGSNTNDGSSWASAKQTVQAAVNAAAPSGGQVWVAAGTYTGCITLKSGVAVYGGFAGTEMDLSQRSWTVNATILDGNQAGSVVTTESGAGQATRLDGFVVRNGKASNGGGIYCSSSSPCIANNIVTTNVGSGVYCSASPASITGNTITGNSNGGVFCSASSATIANNTITGNGSSGITCISASSATIINNTIGGNTTTSYGGGIYCDASSPTIASNTISGNSADSGAGIYCRQSSAIIVNTIVAYNTSGIYSTGTAMPVLKNSCVHGNFAYNYSGLTDPTGTEGNISVDPKLAQPYYGNMHIQPDSPCRDAGDDIGVHAGWLDMDSQPRIQGARVDIGADESDGTAWPAVSSVIVHVNPMGNDANDGSTWSLARRTVQAGVNAAAASGGQVWVAAGTYTENVTLPLGVALYGGFVGSETELLQRNWMTNITILEGNLSGNVITVTTGATGPVRIDGFVIRHSDGASGGGIYCSSGSSPTIANNTITGNTGGGIRCYGATPMIVGNTITCNGTSSSNVSGGGIYCSSSTATILNNRISSNTAGYGGGIYCESAGVTVANDTITGNYASYGGGIYCMYCSPVMTNNTITGNSALDGGGICCYACPSPTIINTIVAFNSTGIYATTGTLSLQCNCVYENGAYDFYGQSDPMGTNGNINADPKLADLHDGSHVHIRPDSPCRDTGDDRGVQMDWTDMDGQPRIQGARVDIGADESNGTVWPDTPNVIVRVTPEGDDANDGSSWALAKRTVQAGIDAAAATGGEVWAKAGTYPARITLRASVHVYGGFDGTETQRSARDWSVHVTILDGNQAGSVVTATGFGYLASTVDGFTIRNGRATTGGGIYCNQASPAITHNIISSNTATNSGGGIYCISSHPRIANNSISGNNASGAYASGGGIYCNSSTPVITNNTISGNGVGPNSGGGGVYCNGGSPVITGNTVAGNTAYYGSGIRSYASSPRIADNLICGNSATQGGGIFFSSTGSVTIVPTIANNTIVGNKATQGGGLYCSWPATITNSVIAFNSSGIYRSGGTLTLGYNCVYGNTAYNYSGLTDPTGTNGNLGVDPQFVRLPAAGADGKWATADDDPGDVHLAAGSPCINACDPASVPVAGEADIDSQPRVIGSRVDIGADEFCWPSDANYDGYVNVGDLQLLVAAWGSQAGPPASANWNAEADCNSDGYVNVGDLQLLVANWGQSLN